MQSKNYVEKILFLDDEFATQNKSDVTISLNCKLVLYDSKMVISRKRLLTPSRVVQD